MSVSILLCEGIASSPDVRLLRVVLRRVQLEIVPSGGKDGLPSTVIALRSQVPQTCAFRDADFPRQPDTWTAATDAEQWTVKRDTGDVMVGWKLRRKEIENYFVDPNLLARVFGWDGAQEKDYSDKLDNILDELAIVTAARMALTACAATRNRLDTQVSFIADETRMKLELSQKAQNFNQGAQVDETKLLATFDRLLPECRRGGKFRQAGLDVFAGKNILARMQQTAGMPNVVKNSDKLIEKVLDALEKAPDSHTWVSEWEKVHDAVGAWTPSP
ncbi:MAG TPA: hypothetical protein PK156_03005 [Polyangium sp.]|nr:hypothetical protein [Polyangium sp.]